ncbi:MAG: hypothetical protein ACYS67_08930, partial [Planctomycetota bacterium]
MTKRKKRGKRKIRNSSRSKPSVSAPMKRTTWLLAGAAIICAAVSIIYLRYLSPKHEEPQTTKPDSNSTELSSSGPADSSTAPEKDVAALKKEAIEVTTRLTKDFPKEAEAFYLLGLAHRN